MLTDQWQVLAGTDFQGRFEFKDIHPVPVIERPVYVRAQRVVLFLWALFGLVFVSAFFVRTRRSTLLKVVLGLAFAGIIIGTTMPAGMKNKMIEDVKAGAAFAIETIVPADKQGIPWQLDTIGHFCLFALFGSILICILEQDAGFTALVYILMVSAGTELAQTYIDGRSGCLSDFFIDAAGGSIGVMSALLGQCLNNKRIKRR
jgi:VanZ family protein